ncbi:MAG: PEP-CTERM sorting domain-containing protein [Phycisphaerae bacterium]|nr:PEP-CTERM sorting domain-containing protein [Phycisphaerae bacterium]
MKRFRILGVWLLFLCLMDVSALANLSELYIFGQVTGSSTGTCPDAFTMEVQEMGTQALFTFTNNCDNDGVLGRIFIMENTLMDFVEILPPEDDLWSLKEENAMLPGGHPLGFTPQNSYGIYANPARPKNGLGSGESLSVLFNLNVDFVDLIGAIDGGDLGLGIHAQSLPGGTSASFSTIPEPATLALIGIGTLLLRRKKRDTAQ